MPLLQSFRNLSPKTRIGVGLGLLAWGAVGLQISDRTEERYFKPTEEDHAALRDDGASDHNRRPGQRR
ncbi:hypothetical protein NUW58_g4400 [Xylaria curta]|uniref:Uncharacterized protein n=1 Tax=Xylaria curta TaxID=42375 RepID=A0ACC1P6M3_9PEZI|nr:hypothetical protein NUW58_g4400 [Xylaria curta]